MNIENIESIGTNGLCIAFAIKIFNNSIGQFFMVESYILGRRINNDKYDFVDVLNDGKYNYFNQDNLGKYQNGETRVMIIKLVNIDKEFISRNQAMAILNNYCPKHQKPQPKKVKVKKIVRKGA